MMGWFRPNNASQSAPRSLPVHLRRHYFELRECQRAYNQELVKLEGRIKRNRLLMREAVRLRVEFGHSVTFQEKVAVFDRIVVLLNQQNEAIAELCDSYKKALVEVNAQLSLLGSPLLGAVDSLEKTWIADLETMRLQVEAIEDDLEVKQIFGSLGSLSDI